MKFLIACLLMSFGFVGFAQAADIKEIALCDSSMNDKSRDQLKNALAHIDSFEYIRSALKTYQDKGYSYCASGVMLTKNIYQYYKFFWNLEVRDQDGMIISTLPMYFQSASIQAHHNAGHKPWIVIPSDVIAGFVDAKIMTPFSGKSTVPVTGEFSMAQLYDIAKTQKWWGEIDSSTFSIAHLGTKDGSEYYMGAWVYGVTTGSVYAQEFTSKVIVFKYDSSAQEILVGDVMSGFSSITSFLEGALEAAAQQVPADTTTWGEYTLEVTK